MTAVASFDCSTRPSRKLLTFFLILRGDIKLSAWSCSILFLGRWEMPPLEPSLVDSRAVGSLVMPLNGPAVWNFDYVYLCI